MAELIDVLTEAGAPAGGCKPKADIHRDGDWAVDGEHGSDAVWADG